MKHIVTRACDPDHYQRLPAELHQLLRRIYAARQVTDVVQLDYGLDRLHDWRLLGGIDDACTLLASALEQAQRILIVADFDADGATSCALAVRALRALGAADVRYVVPNRFEYGYGLTPEIVAVAAQQAPDLIITVDNGISSIDGVAEAHRRGIRVLVTDHHLPGATLPAADAIVNPNLIGDAFPSKALAGVGVIFYVLLALRARLREAGWFASRGITEPNLAQWLDLVALGTVADVVPLDHNNRILVDQGLRRIRAGQCCAGIQALIAVGGRARERLVATDLGFTVGPRINAAGRLEDMSLGIECLLCDDPARARDMAVQLDTLNRERRAIEADMQQQALAALARLHLDKDATLPRGLCLYDADWHQGVIGILAGRLKDRLHRPVIAFAQDGNGALKGSARSVPGLHIRDALDAVATRAPGLITKFGGHAMAAGLSLPLQHFADFARAFADEVGRHLDEGDLRGVIHSDGELAPDDLSLDTAELLRGAGPWGQHFPEPVFHGEFRVLAARRVGEKHLKLVLSAPGGTPIDAIAFNTEIDTDAGAAVRAAFRLDVNEYRGQRSAQLVVEDFEVLA